ncbi:type II and III secretion system protein family protein [Marinivivus vitaminiproducens]|uniref:type II and III secretion system protein family protein n=1 Tax=Marinivivus vitaminiproducens TaxID=3035935 RepID=UPI00279FA40A|nr:type II and III secretion system protein family protein [Geminicoccaceae bacterium SCSIO 64248]
MRRFTFSRAAGAAVLAALASLAAPTPSVRAAELVGGPVQPLDLAVGMGRLVGFDREVESVFLADPAVADVRVVSGRLAYLFGKQAGRTNLFAVAQDRVVASIDLTVGPEAATAELRQARPDSAIDLRFVGGQLVVAGTVAAVGEARTVAALGRTLSPDRPVLDQTVYAGSQQINLRVRFAEVARQDVFRLGINWRSVLSSGDFGFGLATGRFFLPGTLPANQESGLAGLASMDGSLDLDLFLEALQIEGVVSVLAEPNLTAVSGQTASFLAGGEIPIPVPQEDGVIGVDYKSYGVSLAFTPTLLQDERIGIRVKPEVSAPSASNGVEIAGFAIPGITTRRAETTVELASGQTFAIAGLFQRNVSDDLDSVPMLGDLPIVGQLFRSKRFQREETELVILITPYLVRPVASRALVTPADPPGRLGSDAAARARPARAGFIIN